MPVVAALAAALLLAGCAATVHENHFFAAFKDGVEGAPREAVQFYRLRVDGDAQFANARYLSGYYDERAVSLFFNELQGPKNAKLFDDNQTLPGSGGTKIQPLNPTAGEGAFVLIMSSNADSIANAIGSFAEAQVVADAMTRMLNKDRFQAKVLSDAKVTVVKAEATALVLRIEAATQAASRSDKGALAVDNYRRALTALAQGLGYSGPEFATLSEAQTWFTLEDSRAGVAK